jgi:biopolymer transport protein ExbD
MAEMIPGGSSRSKSRARSIRIDLTPMVDLGFLLIAFFMYTTTLARTAAMEINMPDNGAELNPNVFIDTSTITIITTKDHWLAYYEGILSDPGKMKTTSIADIRGVIQRKRKELFSLPASFSVRAHKLHVLIKPMDNSTYDDLVAVLDEMTINDVPFYAIVDVTDEEKQLLTNKLQ